MDGFKEFLESSTIHGLFYIATNRRVARLLWICVVIAGFTAAGVLIQQSFSSWDENPVSTTIESRSISDLEFPGVVVCPAKNSFTTLNPDLIRADKNSWDENKKQRLEEIIIDATYDLNVEDKYEAMTKFFEKDRFFNWYKGESELEFPHDYNKFSTNTAAVSGKFSTPYFGEIFHWDGSVRHRNFFSFSFTFFILVPKEIRKNGSISLVIDIDYDIDVYNEVYNEAISYEVLQVGRSEKADWEQLNATQKKYKKEFSLQGDEYYAVDYARDIYTGKYHLWKSQKRHTGMRVSWYYNTTVQPDLKYLHDNEEFIALANAVHENRTGIREELKRKRHEVLNYRHDCFNGKLFPPYGPFPLPSLFNMSAKEPVYLMNITQETLATAGKLYFYFREGFIQISKLKSIYPNKRNKSE